MVNFSPVVGFVPSPLFVPPPPPLAPPVGVPGIGTPTVPALPPLEVPTNPFVPVPLEPSGIPPLPLPSQFGQPRGLFRESGIPQLPVPAGIALPGPEVTTPIPPPFTGGQCQGVSYRVTVTGAANSGSTASSRTGIGPVIGPCFGAINQFGNTGIGVQFAGSGCVLSGAGTGNTQPQFHGTFQVAGVVRVDGLVDTCGDPPPIREEERAPSPARAFQPNRIQPFRRPQPRPERLPEVNPAPQAPPLPPLPQTPDTDPARRPDRRVPGPPLPIGPVTPPEIVPFTPGTIPQLPTFPQITPTRTPQPPRFPEVPPLPVPTTPTVPTRTPQFPPLPPEAPTKRTPPVILVPPPLTRIPPPVNNDCCAVPEVIRQGNSIRRLLEELGSRGPEDCVDLCEPAVMLDIICQGGLGIPITTAEQAVTVLDLSSALGRLSRQVFEIAQYLNICNPFPDPAPGTGGGCGPGVVGAAIFAGQPGGNGQDIGFGEPPEGEAWVGAIARYVASPGVGVVPSSVAPNRAYTQVIGNVSLRYGVVRGVAQQVRSEWNEVIRPVGAPYATGVYVAAIPQTFVTIFPVSVTISE